MPHPLLLLLIIVSFIVTPALRDAAAMPLADSCRHYAIRHYFAAIDFRRQAGHSASHC
jgi:hypothetical protein